jgi:hypothetical protein
MGGYSSQGGTKQVHVNSSNLATRWRAKPKPSKIELVIEE